MCTGTELGARGRGGEADEEELWGRAALECLRPCTDPESEGTSANAGAMLLFAGLGGCE